MYLKKCVVQLLIFSLLLTNKKHLISTSKLRRIVSYEIDFKFEFVYLCYLLYYYRPIHYKT